VFEDVEEQEHQDADGGGVEQCAQPGQRGGSCRTGHRRVAAVSDVGAASKRPACAPV
jgi:hypothetical protein